MTHLVSLTLNSLIATIENEQRLQKRCERGARQALEWCVRTIEKEHRLQIRCERGARQALEWCVKKIQKDYQLQLRCERGAREALERCVVTLERQEWKKEYAQMLKSQQSKIPETWDCAWSKKHSRWFYWKKDEMISTWTQPVQKQQRRAAFAKGETIQCPSCNATCKAPTQAYALRCACKQVINKI